MGIAEVGEEAEVEVEVEAGAEAGAMILCPEIELAPLGPTLKHPLRHLIKKDRVHPDLRPK